MSTFYPLGDLLGESIAFVLFAFIFVVPGYVCAWALDLFDFRLRLAATRFVIAIVISVAVSPILIFLVERFSSAALTFALLGAFAIAFVAILANGRGPSFPAAASGVLRIALLGAAAWVVVALASLIPLQAGHSLYNSVVAYDFTTRVAIVNAISRSGVPPINPSFYPGHPVRMTYLYYLWYIPCSLVDQLGGRLVDGQAAMVASVAWCGLALMATVALYLRLRNPDTGALAWKAGLLGSGLLLVSGLDIVAALLNVVNLVRYHGDLEHWNEQITAWVGALLWVPHHVAALMAGLAGVMLLHWLRGQSLRKQAGATLVAGLAFASSIGLSVYVTLVFVAFWGIWLIVVFLQGQRRLSLIMLAVGGVALAAAAPFLSDLLRGGSGAGIATFPVILFVRPFEPLAPYVERYPALLQNLAYLLFLPISYLLELGFFFVAGLFWAEQHGQGRWKQNPFHVAEVILLCVTVVIASFLRATVINSNDFGWRAWLPGQFVLLVWGADIIRRYFPAGLLHSTFEYPRTRRLARELQVLLAIGLLTSVADLGLLRIWPMLEDAGIAAPLIRQSQDTQQGRRTLAARQAYDYLNAHTAPSLVIEPDPVNLLDQPAGLYSDRQIALSGHTAYGVRIDELIAESFVVAKVFQLDNWPQIDAACRVHYIDMLVVNDQDAIWESVPKLSQQRKLLYQNNYYALLPCGAAAP